jgi:anti-sigma B factor antagonist
MNFSIAEVGTATVLKVLENITYVNQREFTSLIDGILGGERRNVVLDLSELKFLGSLGIGAIAKFYQDVKQAGGSLVIIRPPEHVFKVFSLTGLAQLIPFFETERKALEDLGIDADQERVVARVDDDDVESKLKRLNDESPEVRRYVAWSLGLLRDPRAISHLEAALQDASGEVREAAADALKKLTGRTYHWTEPE